jgi:hypothetical protein
VDQANSTQRQVVAGPPVTDALTASSAQHFRRRLRCE